MLQQVAAQVTYPGGTVLCRQGDVGDTFYVILDGIADVTQQVESGRERQLATLSAGHYFGEMGLLDNRPRLATVITRQPTHVLEIDGDTLQRLIAASPDVGHQLTRHILAILRANDEIMWQAVVEKEAAQKELEIGRQIQLSFLPPALPEVPGWEIAAFLQPARVVSGDFYDAMALDEQRLLIVVGDVCDKGVGAALYMALFRSLVRAFAEHHYRSHAPAPQPNQSAADTILATIRDTLHQTILFTNSYLTRHHADTNMFATLFFAIVEPESGYVAYVNGGHEPPVVLGPDSVRDRLHPTGPLVGIIPDVPYGVAEVQLDRGRNAARLQRWCHRSQRRRWADLRSRSPAGPRTGAGPHRCYPHGAHRSAPLPPTPPARPNQTTLPCSRSAGIAASPRIRSQPEPPRQTERGLPARQCPPDARPPCDDL
jgi:phosphoserine phosphatase RsbU/P